MALLQILQTELFHKHYILYVTDRFSRVYSSHCFRSLETHLYSTQITIVCKQTQLELLLGDLLSNAASLIFCSSAFIVRTISYRQPMKLGLLLFHLWLYSEDYQGAILFFTLAKKKIDALGL